MRSIGRLMLLAAVLATGCAQVREPQGGAKDEVGPALKGTLPPNGTVRFTGSRILLRFDERVKLDRVQERLLISPPLARSPEVRMGRGDEVAIEWKGSLDPNTTYVFNIGDAVVDITENNPAAGLAYVLSTGDHIDSASVHGTLTDAFTGAAVPRALVLAYAVGDTVKPLVHRPSFFTRTDAEGRFRIAYMRPGAYHLAALNDRNANYRYDLPNEEVAFLDSTVAAGDSRPFALRLFRELPATQQLVEMRVMDDRSWRLVLAKHSDSLSIRQIDRVDDPLTWYPEWNTTRDTVQLWPSDTTLLVGQRFELSERGSVFDTITYRPLKRMPFHVALEGVEAQGRLELVATRPLAAFDSTKAVFTVDSAVVPFAGMIVADSLRRFRVEGSVPKEASTTLLLLPGAFTDIYNGTNDTLRFSWGSRTPPALGQLRLKLRSDSLVHLSGPFLLQLIPAQGSVRELRIAELPANPSWSDLPAGEYRLKLVEDRNGDGRWTTGRLDTGLQPERVHVDPDKAALRSGWEVEVEWVVTP
ncbi:MAG TPA: Ig-like domain-containing protein [Flavobacteriales bacterium]